MITLGPILGYESDNSSGLSYYTVIFRTDAPDPVWSIQGQMIQTVAISPHLTHGGRIYRGEIQITPFSTPKDVTVGYQIMNGGVAETNCLDQSQWEFCVPGTSTPDRQPHLAFCSCNGFKKPMLARDIDPLAMWKRMASVHKSKPLHLLIMGGDQLYCDDLAHEPTLPISEWLWMKPAEQKKRPISEQEQASLTTAYMDHYISCWVRRGKDPANAFAPMIQLMATVPSVMMWDDHDIFDGYGSYENNGKNTPFYKAVYKAASNAFEIHQLRGWSHNRSKLSAGQSHYSLGVKFGHYTVLALDTRSGREPKQIMQESQWDDITVWLYAEKSKSGMRETQNLLVIAPIPVVYRRFKNYLSKLPGQMEVEDDVVDHWNHTNHEGERNRLIAHLFNAFPVADKNEPQAGFGRVTILSGDVHVGGLGYLKKDDGTRQIAQIISSGIMHLPPGAIGWDGVVATSNADPYVIKQQGVTASLERPNGARHQQLVTRNFAHMFLGNDNKLWVTWECEDPEFPHVEIDLI